MITHNTAILSVAANVLLLVNGTAQAYGPRDPALIQYMPLTDFNGEFTPEAGQIIAFALPNGEEAAGMVLGVEGGQVEVDFNHPLAGHEISFRVQIISVSPPLPNTEAP